MAFNILIDQLPTEWRGTLVKTDFRQALRFFRAIADKDMDERTKAKLIVRLFFDELPKASDDLWEFIQHFISGGDDSESEKGGPKLFDFEVDSGRVLAAFWQTYRIDLSTESMHWWKFLELFRGLPDGTMLARVIDIRQKEVPKDADKKYRYALMKAKRAYSLEESDPHSLVEMFKGAR